MYGPICVKVSCDEPRCRIYVFSEVTTASEMADLHQQVNAAIASQGWTISAEGTLCPDHSVPAP